MPLKHSTETMLIILLALVTMGVGMAIAVLPSPAVQPVPWFVLFALTIAYPLALYPLFRRRRADNAFRMLHLAPAAMLIIWLVLIFLSPQHPIINAVRRWFTWGWSLPAVAIVFYALLWFSLDVLRQRSLRVPVIAILFLLFAAFSFLGERRQWPVLLASALHSGTAASASSVVAVAHHSQANLGASNSAREEAYRAELRRMERRNSRLAMDSGKTSVHTATDGALVAAAVPQIPLHIARIHHVSTHLPSSGPATEILLFVFAAGYCGVLHYRAKLRLVA